MLPEMLCLRAMDLYGSCLEWICILRICAWNTRGMEIISFLFCWVCGVACSRCTRQKQWVEIWVFPKLCGIPLLDNLYFVLSLSAFPLEHVIGVSFPRYFEAAGAASPRHHNVHEGYSSSPGRAAGNELTTTQPGCWQENSLTPTRPVRPYYQRITVWAPTAEAEVHAGWVIAWQRGRTLHNNWGNQWF